MGIPWDGMGWDRHELLWNGMGWDRKICPMDKPENVAAFQLLLVVLLVSTALIAKVCILELPELYQYKQQKLISYLDKNVSCH